MCDTHDQPHDMKQVQGTKCDVFSKFAPEGGVPARLGWFLLYFIPMVGYVITWKYLGAPTK